MIDCTTIKRVANVPLVDRCDTLANGALRMLTPFQYPNGASIDLFIEESEPLLGSLILSDLGQTTSYLLDLQVRPWATQKRRQVINDICDSLEVEWSGGRFQIPLMDEQSSDISPMLMRLAQACIRVSDLAFNARLWTAGSFHEEMEEFLNSLDLRYEENVVEVGRDKQEVKFDFRVFGESKVSLVQSLSAASTASAQSMAKDAFIRWYDLGTRRKEEPQRITVIDESNDVFRDSDLMRLDKLSSTFWFPADQGQLSATLAS